MPTESGRAAHDDAVQLHNAVTVLAGVSERTRPPQADRFGRADTVLGHALAAMPPALWDAAAARLAWELLSRYRAQLGRAGIQFGALPVPREAGNGAGTHTATTTTSPARPASGNRPRPRAFVRCRGEGKPVVLAFPPDRRIVDAARQIPGGEYDPDTQTHRYPFEDLPAVVALADAHQIPVSAETRALVPLAKAAADQGAAWEARPPDVYVDSIDRIAVAAPYSNDLDAALGLLNHGQSVWDPDTGTYLPPIHTDPTALLEIVVAHGLKAGDDVRAAVQAELERQLLNQSGSGMISAPAIDIPGLAPGRSLKSQQFPVVDFGRRNRRIIVGDDMGWGKTLSSLSLCAADAAFPVVIVCRPSLTLNWANEIAAFFPNWRVHATGGVVPTPIPDHVDAVIIGSSALATNIGAGKNKIFPWVAQLAELEPRALIVDEGQDTKESTANRSQAVEHLAASVIERNGLVLDLSGTPLVNRPRELCQQLVILGRIAEFGGAKAFLARYCPGRGNSGSQHLDELHHRLLAWGIMVRRADDDALGLPPLRRHKLTIHEAALDPKAMDRYRKAEDDVVAFLADRAAAIAAQLGEDPHSASVRAAMTALAAEHLVKLNTLRKLVGEAKIPAISRWVDDQIRHGNKVLIAAHHRTVVGTFARRYGGLTIQGKQDVNDKERDKKAFQTLDVRRAPVIVVAIGAGGVGHTLTAAHIGVQAEFPWTPGDQKQMAKRIHRLGQEVPVDYYRAIAPGTIDDHMDAVIATKQSVLDQVLDGRRSAGTDEGERALAAEVAWMLTEMGLDRRAQLLGTAP